MMKKQRGFSSCDFMATIVATIGGGVIGAVVGCIVALIFGIDLGRAALGCAVFQGGLFFILCLKDMLKG